MMDVESRPYIASLFSGLRTALVECRGVEDVHQMYMW